MPEASEKLWSCVGSAGVIDPSDLNKIIFINATAQLGEAAPNTVTVKDPAVVVTPPILINDSAVIRYGVVPVSGVFTQGLDVPVLRLHYRGGDGRVVAKLIQVDIASGTETTLIPFDSKGPNVPASNDFQTQTTGGSELELNFVSNAYYVEVTMTLIEKLPIELPHFPPAVQVVQLFIGSDLQ